MLDQVKRLLLAGFGAALYTHEKVEEVVRDLVRGGHLTREQANKLLEELASRGEKGREELASKVSGDFSKVVSSLQPVPRRDFEKLSSRVEAIEKHLGLTRPQDSREAPEEKEEPGEELSHEEYPEEKGEF